MRVEVEADSTRILLCAELRKGPYNARRTVDPIDECPFPGEFSGGSDGRCHDPKL
jgi:hypothetical protein